MTSRNCSFNFLEKLGEKKMRREESGQPVQEFTEYKRTYFGKVNRFDCSLAERPSENEIVLLFQTEKKLEFLGKTIETDAICFGYFWEDRSYNVYHWRDAKGETILIYFNVSRDTKVGSDKVEWLDLVVDVALIPGKDPVVLDEEEIPENMIEGDREIISKTKQQILSNHERLGHELENRSAYIASRLLLDASRKS